jgi:hypothetical protein
VQLLDHLRDDARGAFVLATLDQREELGTCGILHQLGVFAVPQKTHRAMTAKIT